MRILILLGFVVACSESHDPGAVDGAAEDAAIRDSAAPDSAARDAAPVRDAPPVRDASIPDTSVDDRIPLTEEQAECLGLTSPACASCHVEDDMWVLRPAAAPPPPPGIGLVDPGKCDVEFEP